jgi:regulator of protease activity HflC (stomatin/prohibitin superfamily)
MTKTNDSNFPNNLSNQNWGRIAIFAGLIFIFMIINPFVVITAGHRGVVLNFGAASDKVLEEGLHLRIPIMQSVIEIDTRVKKNETKCDAASKDLQNISSIIAVNYHLKPDKVNELYKSVGKEYETTIIDPAVQEVVKGVTANYTAAELITLREQVSIRIKTSLETRLNKYNILIDDFSIKDFQFSTTFVKAIEAKQEAEQLALKAERDLQRIRIEAEQQIATAKAEAETLRLKNVSVSPLLIQLNAVEKWDGKLPVYMLSEKSVPFINIGK